MKKTTIIVRLVFFVLPLISSCTPKKIIEPELKNQQFTDSFWWPEQSAPEGIVRCRKGETHAENALLYSLAGLVAQAQKEGIVDELIWIESRGDYSKWYTKVIHRLNAEERGTFDVWKLLKRYQELDIIKGYVLYNEEISSERIDSLDYSYNIAVAYAGAKRALVVNRKIETVLIKLGFPKLLDASSKTSEECFRELRNDLNRELLVTMHPKYHNNSDFTIANKAMMTYGLNSLTDSIMNWMKPISPVVGWNVGNEIDFTSLPSKYGLFNTASDWCENLIILSAGSSKADPQKIKTLDPSTINFEEGKNFHSFIMSDGDNMQWTIGRFIHNTSYWGSPIHGEFPMGFTSCPINLSMMAPDVLDELALTQPAQTTVIEFGGGYQYPDLFAREMGEERSTYIREFAREINVHLKRTGVKVFGFICTDFDSPEAKEAYQIYVEELDEIVGMIAVQYAPYHGGDGKILWFKNKLGVSIPVVSSKFSLWQDMKAEGGGDVEKVCQLINLSSKRNKTSMAWTAVHAWSYFKNPNSPTDYSAGLKPIKWCIEGLNEDITVVSPEELLWRIRWKNNKSQTLKAINRKN